MDRKERNKGSNIYLPSSRGPIRNKEKEKTPLKSSHEERNRSDAFEPYEKRDISEVSDSLDHCLKDKDSSRKSMSRSKPSTKHDCFSRWWLKKLGFIFLFGCSFAISNFVANSISESVIIDVINDTECSVVMQTVHKEISHNNNKIMISLISGLNEIKDFNKPSVFLYLYKNIPEDYVNDLLKNVTTYASCSLNEQNEPPIELKSIDLRSPEALKDYGYILEKYKDELEKKHIMVVRHLEQVPGFVAQAFHSLCDEITPLVSKSLFIFTMQVENYKYSDFKLVENVLRAKWTDLEEDVFAPLLTRISSMIVRINK